MEKLYKKIINGTEVIKQRNQIIVYNEEGQWINAPEEMILADGWEEYLIDVTPTVNPSTGEPLTLETAKERRIEELMRYDASSAVNEFKYCGFPMWLDKATRAGLMLRVNAELLTDQLTTTLWYGNHSFTLDTEMVQKMLYMVELYASACYDNTQQHMANIMALTTIEEVMNYNFATGYPEKLEF